MDTDGYVFIHIEEDGTHADDLNKLLDYRDIMPWIPDDMNVNMIEEGLDIIVKQQHRPSASKQLFGVLDATHHLGV